MLCPTKNFCGELSADLNADSSRKIRYKIKGKESVRIACLLRRVFGPKRDEVTGE